MTMVWAIFFMMVLLIESIHCRVGFTEELVAAAPSAADYNICPLNCYSLGTPDPIESLDGVEME
jgi:hypothetical protein